MDLNTSHEDHQKEHFDSIAELHEAHYFDAQSQAYRSRFMNPLLTQGIFLKNAKVLEAMCGTGLLTCHQLAYVDKLLILSGGVNSMRRIQN